MRKKTYVTYDKTDYVVRKNQNQIICIIDFSIKLPANMYDYAANFFIGTDSDFQKFLDNNNIERKYCSDMGDVNIIRYTGKTYGYADCLNTDEFDDDFGKKLAQTRAQMKAFDIATKLYDELAKKYNKISEIFNKLSYNCDNSADKCSLHVNELINNKYTEDYD